MSSYCKLVFTICLRRLTFQRNSIRSAYRGIIGLYTLVEFGTFKLKVLTASVVDELLMKSEKLTFKSHLKRRESHFQEVAVITRWFARRDWDGWQHQKVTTLSSWFVCSAMRAECLYNSRRISWLLYSPDRVHMSWLIDDFVSYSLACNGGSFWPWKNWIQ